jgi:Tfp pilus assembly protein PilF
MNYITRILAIILLIISTSTLNAASSINEMPMYGGGNKAVQLKKADEAFITDMMKAGYSRESGSQVTVQKGWDAFEKQNYAIAMKRFNQAWLLDPENGDVYHGFALVVYERDKSPSEAEKYFIMAFTKAKVNANAYVDYGRFLMLQKRYDESLIQLQKAFEKSPKAHNVCANMSFVFYKMNDFVQSCKWAKAAKLNNDLLESSYLEEICHRAGEDLQNMN